ncbi:MAG: hypothetical protein WD648_14185 [Planctomycetaceae bacterium]
MIQKRSESLGVITVRSGFSEGGLMLTPLPTPYNVLVLHSLVTVDAQTAQEYRLLGGLREQALRAELAAWDAASDEAFDET